MNGIHFTPQHFHFQESNGSIDSEVVDNLIHNTAVGLHVHGYLQPNVCRRLRENFNRLTDRSQRSDVPAIKIGADHFGKSPDVYFDEVEAASDSINRLCSGLCPIGRRLRDDLSEALPAGHTLRRATWKGRVAGDVRAVQWIAAGKFALGVHEDSSQITNAGFEVEEVENPIAANLFPFVAESAGEFRVYNLQPDFETRVQLGVLRTGYPYPPEELESIEYIDVKIESGDLILFNGRFLHGVLSPKGDGVAERMLINLFFGKKRYSTEVVSWT